jgi:hypothetical protein
VTFFDFSLWRKAQKNPTTRKRAGLASEKEGKISSAFSILSGDLVRSQQKEGNLPDIKSTKTG